MEAPGAGSPIPTHPATPAVERFFQFSVLGMVAAAFCALAGSGYLDWPTQAAVILALAVRFGIAAGWLRLDISERAIALATIACVAFYPVDYEYVSRAFLPAVLHLILLLGAIKLVGARTDRDLVHLKAIAVLELLGAAVFSADSTFFIFLALFLLLAIASMTSGEIRRASAPRAAPVRSEAKALGRRLGVFSFLLFCGILSMTAVMFFILPRTARAAMSWIAPNRYAPGFTDEVVLGKTGAIQQSSRPVMHIRSYGGETIPGRWRGIALTQFDGTRWTNPVGPEERLILDHGVLSLPRVQHGLVGRGVAYTVQLDETGGDTLFFAGIPETIRIGVRELTLSPGGAFRLPFPDPGGVTYSAYAFLENPQADGPPPEAPLPPRERAETLQLPRIDPRIPQLARAMTMGARGDEEKARALEKRLRHDYRYTLELLPARVRDPLANFLFVRKRGYCEYFSSAMAVMLRTLGIPSRVVSGFQSGQVNPITGWQVVRASDAHSWVEAWLPESGWTLFDPTPEGQQVSSNGFAGRLSLFFDAADQFWRDWVLSYDLDRQGLLAARLRRSGGSLHLPSIPGLPAWWNSMARLRTAAAAWTGVCAAILLLLLFRRPLFKSWWRKYTIFRRAKKGEAQPSDATLLYQRMLAQLARRGFYKPAWFTSTEFAGAIPESELSTVVSGFTDAYREFRFGGRRDAALRMLTLLERLENLPR